MEQLNRVTDSLRNFKETRLSGLKPLPEFVRTHEVCDLHHRAAFPCRDTPNFLNFDPFAICLHGAENERGNNACAT